MTTHAKRKPLKTQCFQGLCVVPVAGLEPARINRRILSAVRLPFRHAAVCMDYTMLLKKIKYQFSKDIIFC